MTASEQRALIDSGESSWSDGFLGNGQPSPTSVARPVRDLVAWAPSRTEEARSSLRATPTVFRYHGWRRHLKRSFDVVAVIISLPLLVPLAIVLAAAVFVSSPGNPFFRQPRIGQNGKVFRCVKFRTMRADAERRLHSDPDLYAQYLSNDFKLSARDDPRVFWFGRLLRRTSLDELPQLFNVLLGQMSLVGPRPVVPAELERYGPWRDAYLAVRPGITGRWQINGRNQVRYPERAILDAEYLESWTFSTDITILLKTIPSVIRRHGSD